MAPLSELVAYLCMCAPLMLTDYVCYWGKPWKMTLKTFRYKMSPQAAAVTKKW